MIKEGSWKPRSRRHQVSLENVISGKTAHINGYGLGVTFSASNFTWRHSFSSVAQHMKFSEGSFSK